jgi:SM-20-related protein
MPPNPETQSPEPVIEILEDLAPRPLHAAAWAACTGKGWYFGHGSVQGGGARFWKMDLDDDGAVQAIWENVRARCETLAGGPLRVIRQYANGHTFGMGGDAHVDDTRPGCFTLLYYPNPEWHDGWQGETLFYDSAGEVALAVKPRPNRAVFFDSRILHNGTSPSRACAALRVTVAFKLERVAELTAPAKTTSSKQDVPRESNPIKELERQGANRVYAARVERAAIDQAVSAHLRHLGQSLRLPGFRPGQVPTAVLQQKYGAQARAETLKRLAAEIVERGLPEGSVASACDLRSGEKEGAMEIHIHATHLPDLPAPDLSQSPLHWLASTSPTAEESAFLRRSIKEQVLDRLDGAYPLPLFPGIVEREFRRLWTSAEAQGAIPGWTEGRDALAEQLRRIADRRIRLGLMISELARRFNIQAASGPELEDRVVDYMLVQAGTPTCHITAEELRELMKQQELAG